MHTSCPTCSSFLFLPLPPPQHSASFCLCGEKDRDLYVWLREFERKFIQQINRMPVVWQALAGQWPVAVSKASPSPQEDHGVVTAWLALLVCLEHSVLKRGKF
jgi:hypothetical protein